LCWNARQIRVVDGDPQGAATVVFRLWQIGQGLPEFHRILRQRQLGGQAIQRHQMSHRTGRAATTHGPGLDHRHLHALGAGAIRARRANDAGAHHDEIVMVHVASMPQVRGSFSSISNWPCAMTKAVPLIRGNTPCTPGWYSPSNTVPRMPAWRHTCPGARLPAAAMQASLALVPVPQGERSYAIPGHNTKLRASA